MGALLVATADSGSNPGAGPAACLPVHDVPAVRRLLDQLASFEVTQPRLLVRPGHAAAVSEAIGDAAGGDSVRLLESADPGEDLRHACRVAEDAREAGDSLAILPAGLACHREALASLLGDPRVDTGALVARGPAEEKADQPVRVEHQRLVSAGSPYHRVSTPNGTFAGVLRVDGDGLGALAGAAGELATLAEKPMGPEAGCPPDLPALLLVGMVRSGVRVDASELRTLLCRRLRTRRDATDAEAALCAVDEDRVLLDSAVKSDDGFFTTHFVSPYSKHIARWAARRGLIPNAVTATSMAIGVAAAACFALGTRAGLVGGAVLLQAAFTADCVDGQLARYTRRFSAFGGWLDAIFDRGKEYVAYAGLAVGGASAGFTSVWALALAALVLQTVRHMIDFSYAAAHTEAVGALPRRPLEDPDDGFDTYGEGGEQPSGTGSPRPSPGRLSRIPRLVGRPVVGLSRQLERLPAGRWAKKIVVLPIGERFLLISVTAAVADARVTFVALLAWGSVAGLYTLAGRVARSLVRPRPGGPGDSSARSPIRRYRDDGPLAGLLGRALAASPPRGPVVVVGTVLGAAWPLVALAWAGPGWVAAGAVWFVLLAGLVAGRSPRGRLDWIAPPLLRLVEYAVVAAMGLAYGVAAWLVFALLGALAFHHYDTVYRVRQRGALASRRLSYAGLGWDLRLYLMVYAMAFGVMAPVYTALAAWLWLLFVGESVLSWRRHASRPALDALEEPA